METTDYRELLAEVLWPFDADADDILVTRIPSLCPDCGGSGPVIGDVHGPDCDHPNAPTIGDLLRWGENVAKAEPRRSAAGPAVWCEWQQRSEVSATGLLAALRTEADR